MTISPFTVFARPNFISRISLSGVLMLFLGMFIFSCSNKRGGQTITLTNTAAIDLTDKPISIQRKDLTSFSTDRIYPFLITTAGDTIPAQLDDIDGDKEWDELFFVINLPPNKKETLQLLWTKEARQTEKKTSVRFGVRPSKDSKISPADSATFFADQLPGVIGYQHFQTDGPTWENDKVAFRSYLDGRNSVDVFGKLKPAITPEDVGIGPDGVTQDNYSVMLPWGTDILAVGNSLGIGGISFQIGDSLTRLGITQQDTLNNVDRTTFQILSKGPVKSMMKFKYNNWMPLGRSYTVQQTTSIWPGTFGFNSKVACNDLKGDEALVIGLVNSNTTQSLQQINVDDKWVVLYTFDKQDVTKQNNLGLALVVRKDQFIDTLRAPESGSISKTYLAKMKISNGIPVDYYAIAAWELSDPRFKDEAGFKTYLTDFVKQLSAEVKIDVR